jgi:hypothetical protein
MKNPLLTIFGLFCFISIMNAQLLPSANSAAPKNSIIKNGTIFYKLTVESEDPQAKMLNGSTLEFSFSGTDSKMVGLVMGGLVNANLIVDGSANNGLALLSLMGQKKAIRMNADEIKKAQSATANMNGVKITPISGTQKIAGHTCKKVMVTDPNNPEVQTVVFVCESIKPEAGGIVDNMISSFKGFPLGMEVKSNGSKMILMASEVSTKIPKKSDFKQDIPTDYQETTMEQLKDEFGAVIKD